MSTTFDLNSILSQLARDKGIDRAILIEAIESAVLSAARKHFGHSLNLETKFNEETGEVEVIQFKTVVEKVEDSGTQVSLGEARRDFDSEAMVGDELGRRLETAELGRIAAQTAKQVIIQKFRDAERDVIYDEFKNSKGDLINGIVQRYDRGNLIVNLGRTEAIVPKREQISRERYRQGDRVRALILDIDRSARGPQIILSRSHPDFLRKLFALEVPEIAESVIEIKAVAREPGERAKIAVISSDQNVDPVGACVGVKGSRVQAVVQELRGERIDIITWTADEPSFVARALQPAEVARVVVDEDEHKMEVIVPDDQLSLAIGRGGQNVKLASKLSGWKIDVRSVSVAEEEAKRARQSLELIPNIQFTHAELLFQEGFRSARQVADASLEELCDVEGLTQESASEILRNAREYVAKVETDGLGASASEEVQPVSDLEKLYMSSELREKLVAGGISTVQALLEREPEDWAAIAGITNEDVDSIQQAADAFIRGGAARAAN